MNNTNQSPKDSAASGGQGFTTKKLILVDDHPMMRTGLRILLEQSGEISVCAETDRADEVPSLVQRHKPDAVILDLTLRGKNGLELLKELSVAEPLLAILVVSMHDEMVYAERCLRAGARGYIMKEAGGEKVLEAVRAVVGGRIYVSERVASQVLSSLSGLTSGTARSPIENLTTREREIYRLIGKGLSTKKIAEQLGLSPKTVDVHRANIKETLGAPDLPTLIHDAVRWVESEENKL